jgi:hypothetical protein
VGRKPGCVSEPDLWDWQRKTLGSQRGCFQQCTTCDVTEFFSLAEPQVADAASINASVPCGSVGPKV